MPLGKAAHLLRRANANKGRIARSLGNAGKHGFWALADQGVASLGSFGIFVLLAREFAQRDAMGELGRFGMLFEWMWTLNAVQGALVVYPLTVKAATSDRAQIARMAGACGALTLAMAPLVGGLILVVATVISTLSVGVWAAMAAVTWQVQETTRRALMAELRFREALWGDTIRYLGHVAGVAVLAQTGYFSLEGVFAVLVATSVLGALVQAIQLKLRVPGAAEVAAFARDGWVMGRWLLAGNASSLFTVVLFTANFYYWWGAAVVGVAFALNNLLRFTNPILFAISSLVMPHAARARAEAGLGAAKRVLLKFLALGALILAPYLGALILLPGLSIRIFLKDPTYAQFWLVLSLSAMTQALIYLGTVLGVFLNAVERSRRAFVGQVVYSAMFVLVGAPMTALWGIMGAAVGGLLAAGAMLIVNGWSVNALPAVEPPTDPDRTDEKRSGFEVIPESAPTPAPATPAV